MASMQLTTALAPELEGQDIKIIGVVDSLPVNEDRRTQFDFHTHSIEMKGVVTDSPGRIKLSWYNDPPYIKLGQKWQLTVRLKRPRGFMNPGTFDYEQWLFSERIRAQGYVRPQGDNHLLDDISPLAKFSQVRQTIADEIFARSDELKHEAIITALSIGDRQALDDEQWRVLLVTGTNHLMAISGLHIGLVAGLFYGFGRWLWSRSTHLINYIPAQKVGAMLAIIGAFYYSFLAGFSIPTQRALIMVVVVMIGAIWLKRRTSSETLSIALLLVLIWDPLAALSPSFWLSFAAVALLIYGLAGRVGKSGLWWKWGRAQWLLSLGLAPLLLFAFQKASLVSPLANIIAVPWVSFTVVPLSLLSSTASLFHSELADGLFLLSDASFQIIWVFLCGLADLPWAQWQQPQKPIWVILSAAIGILLLLAPRGLPLRGFGLIWLLPLFLVSVDKPKEGEIWFTLLDVGQGLSAVVRTANHVLVYDTGPKFSDSFDAGRAVVVPYLMQYLGVNRIDKLILGHGDNDHIGGASSVISALEIGELITSAPEALNQYSANRCHTGEHWQWDGINFEILHPSMIFQGNENDLSCVLRIRSESATILITGDIEKRAERYLLTRYPSKLDADILIVPHHGSLTSSTTAFIDAVSPSVALFPVGYRNQFGFPKTDVLKRYESRGIQYYDTARHGAISFKLNGESQQFTPKTFRDTGRYYWHGTN